MHDQRVGSVALDELEIGRPRAAADDVEELNGDEVGVGVDDRHDPCSTPIVAEAGAG
jgi:hypothetical protein